MSRENRRSPSGGRRRTLNARRPKTSDYEIGYGKPPTKSRFQGGRSGNPKGRPKGSKNEATILHGLMNQKIDIRMAGRTRKVTVLEAIFLRATEDALKGNVKTAAFLLNRYSALQAGDSPQTDDLSLDDRAVLNSYLQRLQAELNGKGPKS